jgi:hypothetical protein
MAKARAYSAAPKFSPEMRKRMGDLSGGAGTVDQLSKAAASLTSKKSAHKPSADSWNAYSSGDAWNSER